MCYIKSYPKETKDKIEKSLIKIIDNSYHKTKEKYLKYSINLKEEDVGCNLYKNIRARNHYGKNFVENFIGNSFKLTPFLDIEINKLQLNDPNCTDRQLLMAVIFDRYEPDLLSFDVEGNRFIDKETIKYAHKINGLFFYYQI